MKIYNHTRIPTALLEPLLSEAAKAIGARFSRVPVRVTWSSRGAYGRQLDADAIRSNSLARKPRTKEGIYRKVWVKVDGGYLFIRIGKKGDPLERAEKAFQIALHEWAHIRDRQRGERFGNYNRRWANRPHERRAECQMRETLERGLSAEAQEAILNLAVWMADQTKGETR